MGRKGLGFGLCPVSRVQYPDGITGVSQPVATFEIDAFDSYVAVVTSEEGHPMLSVYDFRKWLDMHRPSEPAYVLNPYPGGLHLSGWENNDLLSGLSYGAEGLRFSTNGPVLEKDNRSANAFPLEETRDFRLLINGHDSIEVNEIEDDTGE
jgi:hypothetical protein